MPRPVRFPLYLRVPRWCEKAGVKLNDRELTVPSEPLSYLVIERTWQDGDRLVLQLPRQVTVHRWEKNKDAVSVDYGPLTFSLKIGEKWTRNGGSEKWPDWEVFPTTDWNYGLVLDRDVPARSFEVQQKPGPLAPQPFTLETVPIELRVKARKIPAWQQDYLELVGPLQSSPALSDEPEETVTLVPMGAARLRISMFPTIGTGAEAHAWIAPRKPTPAPYKPSASHVHHGDNVNALCDGLEPAASNDHSIPRFTWWPQRGTQEWVQYDFPQPRPVAAVAVYWFDDTGRGQCRVPQSWQVQYKDGAEWKPVEAAAACGTTLNKYNRVEFKPVTTLALRLSVQLQSESSGGILEWKVEP